MRAPATGSAGGLRRFALVALGIALAFVFGRGASLPCVSAATHPVVEHPVTREPAPITRLTKQHVAQHRAHAHHRVFQADDDDDDDDDGDDSLAVTYWNDLIAAPALPAPCVPRLVDAGLASPARPARTMTSSDAPRTYDARGPPMPRV